MSRKTKGLIKPPLARMIYLAQRLRGGLPFHCGHVAAQLEVGRKTVLRDLEFMRDRLGYEFEYDCTARTYRLVHAPEPLL